MRIKDNGNSVTLWASASDTYHWATKPGAVWPCSTLSGHRFVASFDENGLYDFSVNGRRDADFVDGHEFSSLCADLLTGRISPDHPCYFVTVGQFRCRALADARGE